jgi:hypothetical protein
VRSVQWPRPLDVNSVRARWVYAQWWFSPLADWSPPRRLLHRELKLPDRQAASGEVAAALSVVSSRPEYWEAQAQVVVYCSVSAEDPAPQWEIMAELDPSGETWAQTPGLPSFLSQSTLAVPRSALVAAARVISASFQPATLDGAGYLVGLLAGPDWEECMERCRRRSNTDPLACFIECSSER